MDPVCAQADINELELMGNDEASGTVTLRTKTSNPPWFWKRSDIVPLVLPTRYTTSNNNQK